MKLIGAGFGRTGTDSLRLALEHLLDGRCYHMKELVKRRDHRPRWERFVESGGEDMDWAALLEDYVATVDWPNAAYYDQLMQVFPDAKVLLSVREPQSWFESFQVLVRILGIIRALSFIPGLRTMSELHDIVWKDFEDLRDRDACIEVFERHIERVRAHVPEDRLLVFRVQEGWSPLCEFLDVPVPDHPFPHVNSRGEVQRLAAREIAKEIARAPLRLLGR